MLIPAFLRVCVRIFAADSTQATKDPFLHARNAGVMALGATLSLYTPGDCANRILPALGPLCVDPETSVREQGII